MGTKKLIKPQVFQEKKSAPQGAYVIDIYERALKELFFIEHPNLNKDAPELNDKVKDYIKNGNFRDIWIYYPNKNTLVRSVEEEIYFKLRTSRNRNIITFEEQQKYRNINIGIIGLSTGSVLLSSIISTGGPKTIKLADYDDIEVTNLNRMNASLLNVGQNKVIVAAQLAWEVDPFINLDLNTDKITEDTIEKFILSSPKLDIFIDSMDSLELKIKAREICRQARIPCLMATSNGDGIILDVERFDIEPNRKLFHGRLGNISAVDLKYESQEEWIKKALQIVDVKILHKRVVESIAELRKTLGGVPQLSSTLELGAAMTSYAIRKIANNDDFPSGRYLINLDSVFK